MQRSVDKFETQFNKYKDADGKIVQDKIKITKRVYTLRKQAYERREWKKFAEVADIPRGEHKRGDMIIGMEVKIETEEGAQQGEIDIVKKFSRINTETIKMKKQQEKLKQLNKNDDDEDDLEALEKKLAEQQKKQPLRGAKKLEEFAKLHADVSVQLKNLGFLRLAETESQQEEVKREFEVFLASILGQYNRTANNWKLRLVKERPYGQQYQNNNNQFQFFRDIAYISFPDEGKAEEAADQLDSINYQDCIITAQVSEKR
ncbi:hypothetical protein PPERSA_02890 [Pseudocohnilembus persalinus]|uniref:RRM domain-containing protein n=1 Tax=Pseudocohnilembus persalinus TaxID=266149 RepID=A0A0V0QMY1_PSEPJ|nr:hypothetical protein PPERSA_02890 [Pseudocohnilembus persalinus]|eukprot:KRX03511.1 hypothetical protein PPERSA_02890 [Pseudocohnilembus persalinus]